MKTTIFPIVILLSSPWVLADTGIDKNLYQNSIQATKQSIADETLGSFYQDALDYIHDKRYEDALEQLDKIYSINPHFQDVESLRVTIRKKLQSTQTEATMDTVRDNMKKGDVALRSGQRVVAVNYWKQALTLNPDYGPAKKKIQEVNQAMAKKEFEAGYIHYHNGDLEDALEAWSNAVALDPTYKQRGLLLLMSKTEVQVKNDRIARLAAQGFDQYNQGLLEDSLHTYEELSAIEPRHEDARRMRAKIKIQLGQAALKAAQAALDNHNYSEAMQQADTAIKYTYEVTSAQAIKAKAEQASKPKPKPPVETPLVKRTPPSPSAEEAPPPPAAATKPVNPEEAQMHYRKALAAMRTKDFHLALQELDIASQLDATDEHIYMARQRAQQEWAAASGSPNPGAAQ
jgi:tetratricopeptide (TPR) repeat protein